MERANWTSGDVLSDVDSQVIQEPMPTDKVVDISPLALRMSSPFNPSYWASGSNSSS